MILNSGGEYTEYRRINVHLFTFFLFEMQSSILKNITIYSYCRLYSIMIQQKILRFKKYCRKAFRNIEFFYCINMNIVTNQVIFLFLQFYFMKIQEFNALYHRFNTVVYLVVTQLKSSFVTIFYKLLRLRYEFLLFTVVRK